MDTNTPSPSNRPANTRPSASVTGAGESWVDKFGRVRQPRQTFIADDGAVSRGQGALQAASDHFANSQAEHQRAVRALSPRARRAYVAYLRTRRTQGRRRTPKPAAPRTRGSRRSSSSSRSAGGGGSGDPDDSEPPGLTAGGHPERRCKACGADIGHRAHQASYCEVCSCPAARVQRCRRRKRHDPVPVEPSPVERAAGGLALTDDQAVALERKLTERAGLAFLSATNYGLVWLDDAQQVARHSGRSDAEREQRELGVTA